MRLLAGLAVTQRCEKLLLAPLCVWLTTLALLLPVNAAQTARSLQVLYTFTGGDDGGRPDSSLIADDSGNLYGTTYFGGVSDLGVVFKLLPSGQETVLHAFGGGLDGADPTSSLIMDRAGNLYGTTFGGGGKENGGTVFKVAPDGTETILHSFDDASGTFPDGGVIMDRAGNLYGTTLAGGTSSFGTVFEVTPKGRKLVLYNFKGGADGANPTQGVIEDKNGNFFGTTQAGGASNDGTVFELSATGTETVLHAFSGETDGCFPESPLITDRSGNLYGTTSKCAENERGVVYKLAPDGTLTVLYTCSGRDVAPAGPLLMTRRGNIFGTTYGGLLNSQGTIFKLNAVGSEKSLYVFSGGDDGANPANGLIKDKSGELLGVAQNGGAYGFGTIFKLTK